MVGWTQSLRKRSTAVGLVLVLVCAAGFALRLHGVGHLLPTVTPLDAATVSGQVDELRASSRARPQPMRTRFYPLLLARTVAWLPAPAAPESQGAADAEEHLRRASAPWVQIRVVSIVLSMIAVPLTWWFARRFLGAGWALVAAALVATSLLHVTFSSQERPHGPAASFILLAVLAAIRSRRRPGIGADLLAGVSAGLAIGSLHYGVFALGSLLGARLRTAKAATSSIGAGRRVAGLVLALVVVAAFVRWMYPFEFGSGAGLFRAGKTAGETTLNLSDHALFIGRFHGRGFREMFSDLCSYDPVLLAAAIAGAAVLGSRVLRGTWKGIEPNLRDDAFVAACFVAPFVLVVGLYDESYERFLLPLVPFAASLGAFGIRAVVQALTARLRSSSLRSVARPALAALAPALAAIPALHLASDRATPDTLRCAADWIREQVASEDHVVVFPYVDLPILDGDAAMSENAKRPWESEWIRYQMRLRPDQKLGPRREIFVCPGARLEALKAIQEDPLGYFRRYDARYVVIAATDNPSLVWWKAREAMLEHGRLVQRFSCAGTDAGSNVGFLQRYVVSPLKLPFFLFVIRSVRMGPVLEIFRLHDSK